jgi:hypothetical protein
MNFICKSLLAAPIACILMAGTALATTVGANGSVSVFWTLDYATDVNGNLVDGTGAVTFTGPNTLSTSSVVTTENGIASDTKNAVYSFVNTSSDIIIYWNAALEALTNAGASSTSSALGNYYFDSNTFVSVGGISAFSSTNGSATCSNNNPNSSGFDCFGYSQGFQDNVYDYVSGILNPGETFSFELAVQSFATTRFTPTSPVPLPASGILLGCAMLLLGASSKRNWRAFAA